MKDIYFLMSNILYNVKLFIIINTNTNTNMFQSQKLQRLRLYLSSCPQIFAFLNKVHSVASKFTDYSHHSFTQSAELHGLISYMNSMRIPGIGQWINQLKQPQCIVALPIQMQSNFTLFFVIVPSGMRFNWHNHPQMTGLTKCVHGKLKITTIDFRQLLKMPGGLYQYPQQKQRVELLQTKSQQTISTIYPHSFNIHKIEALELSAFFDLLMPDYPDNQCAFYDTINEQEGKLILRKLHQSTENIKGLDQVISQYQMKEKFIVKNVILK